jgi:GT2 family glycosyltransferase/aminoglycoside phosphotransferase
VNRPAPATISVLVVSYGTVEDLRTCLGALRDQPAECVVVVDNGSKDGSVEMVRTEFPWVSLIANDENRGYAAAANQGLAACTSEYVLLLNADTVPDSTTAETLRNHLEKHSRAALVGPRLLNADGTLQPSCYPFLTPLEVVFVMTGANTILGSIPMLAHRHLPTSAHDRDRVVPWLKGAALGIRLAAFNAVGGFDEGFFMYGEETDLAYRLAGAGWEMHFTPAASVVHREGASTPAGRAAIEPFVWGSLVRFYRLHYSRARLVQLSAVRAAVMAARIGRDRMRLRREHDPTRRAELRRDIATWQRILRGAFAQVDALSADEQPRLVSPLEALHPEGRVERFALVGSGCPPMLLPPHAAASADRLDAVIFAPGKEERGTDDELLRQLSDAAGRLEPDGFAYVVASPSRRRAARRALVRSGLSVTGAFVNVPDAGNPRYLVPLDARAGRYAFARLVSAWPRRGRLVSASLRTRAGRATLERVLGSVSLVARRPGARTAFAWLSPGLAPPPQAVVTMRNGRDHEDRLTLIVFSAGDREPARVVKLAESKADLEAERTALEEFGASARAAGASVPLVVATAQVGRRFALAQSALTGTTAAAALATRPESAFDVLAQLEAWLERWHLETRAWVEPAQPVLERQILAPLERLGTRVRPSYREFLRARCERVAGTRLCVVAAHNDLTMFNVLLDTGGRLGIVDWGGACGEALPLTDLAYACVDAVAAAGRYRDRVAAFDAAYGPDGQQVELVRGLTRRAVERLELPYDVAELAFHATWLLHAANEASELGPAAPPGPFNQILERVRATDGVE